MTATIGKKRIALFGATGLAGSGVLKACLEDSSVREVVALTRKSLGFSDPKVREVLCADFADLGAAESALAGVDACFYCLGTASGGVSEKDYRVITKDYALEAARVLKAASPGHLFFFISGNGTRIDSRWMWARVKAETEEALEGFGLAGIVCLRPAMILADRAPSRMPTLMRTLFPLLRLMRFFRSLSIHAEDIGRAMLELLHEGRRTGTLENAALRDIASAYAARQRPAAELQGAQTP